MKSGTITAIDPAGRVLIPKRIRLAAAIAPGTTLEASCEDGRIVLAPVTAPVRIERRGRFFVATPEDARTPLEQGVVEETRQRIRRERDGEPG